MYVSMGAKQRKKSFNAKDLRTVASFAQPDNANQRLSTSGTNAAGYQVPGCCRKLAGNSEKYHKVLHCQAVMDRILGGQWPASWPATFMRPGAQKDERPDRTARRGCQPAGCLRITVCEAGRSWCRP